MTQAVARATSLGASAVLMGGAVLIALSMTYAIPDLDFPAPPPPIEIAPPEPPPPPPPPVARPQAEPLTASSDFTPLTPLQTVSTTAPLAPVIGPVADGPVEITAPHWQRRPRDLTHFYPERALARNVEGEVLLDCSVRVSGLLDCSIVSESPTGWGFADAAQRIARAHRIIPATRGGLAVEGRYVMRVPFEIE